LLLPGQENTSITLNFIPIYDSGVNGSSGSNGTGRLVVTIYEDEANRTQTYNVTDTSGSHSFTLPYKRATPGVVLFEARLFVGAVGSAVATNRITVNWLATPEFTAIPPTLNTNEEATIVVTPFLYPPGSDVEDEPISGLLVRFEILSGGGSLMTARVEGSNSMQQPSRATPLLVPTNSDGEALAKLINPGSNASTTVVGISLELGPGVGRLDLGWRTNVTWTVEPASEATIAITGPEFTLVRGTVLYCMSRCMHVSVEMIWLGLSSLSCNLLKQWQHQARSIKIWNVGSSCIEPLGCS